VHRADEATQVAPRPLRTSALLGLAGLFVGVFAVGLLQVVDRRTRSADEVADILGAPLLAGISAGTRGRAASESELVMLTDSEGRQSEEYRILAATVELSNVGGGSRVLLVASALGGEGKSSVASNLSIAAARAGRSVALVELDLRRPRLTTRFGLGRSPGITNVLTAAADLDDALIEIDVGHPYDGGAGGESAVAPLSSERGRLFVIPAGPIPPNPADFAAADGIGDLLRTLRAQFDLVVVDAPPWLVVGDALAVARHVDGIVVTVRDRSTARTALQELRRRLDVTGAPVVGFVLTNVRPGQVGGYSDYTSRSPRAESRRGARRVASGAGLSSLLRKPEPPER
jgi:Mrp family chromosome partitioning ATPase